MVRCKFRVSSITINEWSQGAKQIRMVGVKSEPFGEWTPNASLEMTIYNENASKQFELGKEYYVDFSPAIEKNE